MPVNVGVIGCGPAGISFLHAISTRRQKLEKENDVEGLSKLPDVTVFECAPEPGGVWRSERAEMMAINNADTVDSTPANLDVVIGKEKEKEMKDTISLPSTPGVVTCSSSSSSSSSSSDSSDSSAGSSHQAADGAGAGTNMYEALWTNGPKECFEFFDYTFLDHFGPSCELPPFMPRQHILEYILKRATRNNPSLFDDSVRFNTKVTSVIHDDSINKFKFTTHDLLTNEQTVEFYDKCIWAGGENGDISIPKSIQRLLDTNNYKGQYLHSAAAGAFLPKVKGKNILMIGDAYSAEDLTLQAIKLGAEEVNILSRSGSGICDEVGAWPEDRVNILDKWVITGVTDDGMGIRFAEAEYDCVKWKSKIKKNGQTMELEDVDAIIFCTGYAPNMKMLDSSLSMVFEDYEEEGFEDLPKDWTMPTNAFTDKMNGGRDIKPDSYIVSCEAGITPGIYRGFLISNTNMMFALEMNSIDIPLFDIDVCMWLFLAQIVGDYQLPSSADKMNEDNASIVAEAMKNPSLRGMMDMKYRKVYYKMLEETEEYKDYYNSPVTMKYETESEEFKFKRFTKTLSDASYPLSIGSEEALNEKGNLLVQMSLSSSMARVNLEEKDEVERRTFRDTDPSPFVSIYTGTMASPFKKLWMELDDHDPNLFQGGAGEEKKLE